MFCVYSDDTKIMNNKSVHQLDRCIRKQMKGKMFQNILNSRFHLVELMRIADASAHSHRQ